MKYRVLITVEVLANSETQAYRFINRALACDQSQRLEYIDAEVVKTMPEDDDVSLSPEERR